AVVAELDREERVMLVTRQTEWNDAVSTSTLITVGGSAVLLLLMGGAGVMTSRDYRARETAAWIRAGQTALGTTLQGEQRLDTLGANVLRFLAGYLDAQAGAVYIPDGSGDFYRVATYAISASPSDGTATLRPGDGLVGQAAKDNRPLHVTDVPSGYLAVTSS